MAKTLPNKTRGEFRALYEALPDHPRFQALSPQARLLFYTLKLSLGASGIGTLYGEQITERSGMAPAEWGPAADELAAHSWIQRERRVWWLVAGLEHEPTITLANANHRKHIENHLAGLPRYGIVRRYAAHYELDAPFPAGAILEVATAPRSWNPEGDREGDPPGDGGGVPEGDPGGDRVSTPHPTLTPPHIKQPANFETSEAADAPAPEPPPAAGSGCTYGDLLQLANHHLGLGQLSPQEQAANRGILRRFMERSSPGEVRAAILGAARLRDRGAFEDWPTRPVARTDPATLRILAGTKDVRSRNGDGAVVSLWARAVETHYRRPLQAPRKRESGLERIGDILLEAAG